MFKIAIPRGLYFYKYFTLWDTFFKGLGVDVVTSKETNKQILTEGINSCVSEACLPIKVYFGHVMSLVGKSDFIFLPRFTSISKKQYICPEVCGAPDMVRNSIKPMQTMISPEINLRNTPRSSWEAAVYAGEFFTKDRTEIRRAYDDAVRAYRAERAAIRAGALQEGPNRERDGKLTVAVIGHSYTVYDGFLNMELIKKLKSYGIKVLTLDMLDYGVSWEKCGELPKRIFWDYGTRAYGGAVQLIENGSVDGILTLTSFGCGVDSLVDELVENKIRQQSDIPFMKLVLDEHSAEAGFLTRIEAFVDMIIRRKAHEGDISAFGEHVYRRQSTVG